MSARLRPEVLERCSECKRYAVLIGKEKLCFLCKTKKGWEQKRIRKKIRSLRRQLKIGKLRTPRTTKKKRRKKRKR